MSYFGMMVHTKTFEDIHHELDLMGDGIRAQVRAGLGKQWNRMISIELMERGGAALVAYEAEYAAFQAGEKIAWAAEDLAKAQLIPDGVLLYACASALYDIKVRMDVEVDLTEPAHDTADTTAAEWLA
jgi:hypothetical protein